MMVNKIAKGSVSCRPRYLLCLKMNYDELCDLGGHVFRYIATLGIYIYGNCLEIER